MAVGCQLVAQNLGSPGGAIRTVDSRPDRGGSSTVIFMQGPNAAPTIEQELKKIKGTLSKYKTGHPTLTPEVIIDLTKAIHDLSDHVIALDRRLKKLEEDQPQWTTRGWIGPEGTNV